MGWEDRCDVSEMLGVTLAAVEQRGDDEVHFRADDGRRWLMFHEQDCCESVTIEEVIGDLDDLVGSPLVESECVEGETSDHDEWGNTQTWTFYKFRTAKGAVTLRWLGESNGYYSESVDFERRR